MAILTALGKMLEYIPVICQAFLPSTPTNVHEEYIRSFQWCCSKKGSRSTRHIDEEPTSCDPVVTELITGARGSEESISTSYIYALANVIRNASQNVGEKAWESCIEIVSEAFRDACSGTFIIVVFLLIFSSVRDHRELLRSNWVPCQSLIQKS
jgi:hypothetical protein